ncbi:MAG: hypothetical protein GY923_21685 [Aestuariibacter sp.]|uniref:hypothetical protein n=1 Tax=Marisediminitalea aggregata TaxID=634436 RepID=UPI0020CF7AF6|nr:hypothetical protein [Marisediminitalea aggregata]MCP3863362.1 hypothetical protein [Aestuariibacter sp.]MCP4234834.1 hypothetical protein [Aestuariibacter sp.]MCP4525354.1 hypothetical protein [Aestuariibacter sp.]MCP4950105.1 hypothetical protein [Aestuariibacter sp.]MCP9477033.1 hypothetical protein [Marisediminitalea aggregata]
MTMSANVSTEYNNEIQSILDDYQSELQEVKEDYLLIQADPTVTFEMLVDVWQAHHDYTRQYNFYVVERPNTFSSAYQSEKWQKFCEDDSLESIAEANAEKFAKITDEIIVSLEKRVVLEVLEPDEGLAAIAAYSHGVAPQITLKGERFLDGLIRIGPLFQSQHFELMKLKQGKYTWDRVKLGWSSNGTVPTYTFFDFADKDLSFEVNPGHLNFTGVFEFDRVRDKAGADLLDRPAIVLQSLEQQYPYLLKRLAWYNALAPDDPFLDFYYTKRYGKESAE